MASSHSEGLGYEDPEGLQREGSWRAVDVVSLREIAEGPPVQGGFKCALGQQQGPSTCNALAVFAQQMAEGGSGGSRALGPHPWLMEARYVSDDVIRTAHARGQRGQQSPARVLHAY